MEPANPRKAYTFAILAVLFWSTVPTAFKLGLQFQDSYQLLSGASLFSFMVLTVILVLQGKISEIRTLTWKDAGFSALMGLINPVAYYLVLFRAYDILPAQIAQPLNMVWPLVLVLVSIPILHQRIRWINILAMTISFSGVVLVSLQGGTRGNDPENTLGILLALSSAFIWSFYWIITMRDRRDPVVRLTLNFFFASLYLLAGGLFKDPFLPSSPEGWYTAAYAGLFEMGITFALWLMALRYSPTTDRVSNLVYIAPFLNLIFVHIILKEEIFSTTLPGIVLVVTGILIQNTGKGHAAKA